MKINDIFIPEDILEKINTKHSIEDWEVNEVFFNPDAYISIRKSQGKYVAYGQTFAGRYLLVGFKYHKQGMVEVRTARDMTDNERKLYRR